MAVAISGSLSITGFVAYTNPLDLSTPSDRISIGANNFDAILDAFSTGTGATAGAADIMWHDERILTTTATDNLDLAGGLTNPWGGTLTSLARVKLILIDIDAPATGVFLRVGPGVTGASNPWIGPWAQVASNYVTVYDTLYMSNRTDGWGTITGGSADSLSIYNSTASSITYRILIVGASA